MRIAARRLCLLLLALGALACREEPSAPVPVWARDLCVDWARPDGSCDLEVLMADYEECLRTQGAPETQRMLARGVRSRPAHRGGARKTHLCLERRSWFMTDEGLERWLGKHPKRAASSP